MLAREVHRFLGVVERPADADGLGVINPSAKDGPVFDSVSREQLLARYAEPNRRLAAMLGQRFRAVVSGDAGLVRLRITSVGDRPHAGWAEGLRCSYPVDAGDKP